VAAVELPIEGEAARAALARRDVALEVLEVRLCDRAEGRLRSDRLCAVAHLDALPLAGRDGLPEREAVLAFGRLDRPERFDALAPVGLHERDEVFAAALEDAGCYALPAAAGVLARSRGNVIDRHEGFLLVSGPGAERDVTRQRCRGICVVGLSIGPRSVGCQVGGHADCASSHRSSSARFRKMRPSTRECGISCSLSRSR
jgi:hypothetical protein